MALDKPALRVLHKKQLEQRSEAEKREASARICEQLLAHPALREASGVALYHPLRLEVQLQPLVDGLLERGAALYLPRIEGPGRFVFARWFPRSSVLKSGVFRIQEPLPDAPLAEPLEIQVVLVPGLAFDRTGGRLGKGGGYYDRALVESVPTAARVGLAFACQVMDQVPMEPWDCRMDWLVTEQEVLFCGARSSQ